MDLSNSEQSEAYSGADLLTRTFEGLLLNKPLRYFPFDSSSGNLIAELLSF